MRSVRLGATGIVTSALGFGCADMFRLPRRSQRRRLLEVAWESGITHFDVAPMYGLGLAEAELGALASGARRDQVTITTKFGITPSPAAGVVARVQGPARRMLGAHPALRARLQETAAGPGSGRRGALLYRSSGYGAAAARESLERSLRALRTDYIDVFLLHDPEPGDARTADDVSSFLEDRRQAGVVRAWGVAGERTATVDALAVLGAGRAAVRQIRDDVFSRMELVNPMPDHAQISYGIVGRALPRIVAAISASAPLAEQYRATGASTDRLAAALIRNAAEANPTGVVLFNSVNPARVQAMAQRFDAPPDLADATLDRIVGLATEVAVHPSGQEQR